MVGNQLHHHFMCFRHFWPLIHSAHTHTQHYHCTGTLRVLYRTCQYAGDTSIKNIREEEKFVPYFLHHNPDIAFRILFSIQCLDMNFDTGIREGSRQEKFAI